ncbi:MAG: hypothetical protein ABRQ24_02440 [Syntrophomonadaceae bacterium]
MAGKNKTTKTEKKSKKDSADKRNKGPQNDATRQGYQGPIVGGG